MITVGLDARYGVLAHRRGIGVYVHQLLAAWHAAPPDGFTCVAFTDGRADAGVMRALAGPRLSFRTLSVEPFARWEQWAWPRAVRECGCDLIHGTANIGPPLSGPPLVLTLHDVIEWHRGRDFADRLTPRHRLSRLYRMRAMAASARQAAEVITVSQHARRDMVATLGLDERRITVIPLAPSPPGEAPDALAPLRLGVTTPYAFALGALDARKNAALLWQVFSTPAPAALALVGFEPPALRQAALAATRTPQVVVAGFVSEGVRAGLLAGSTAFLYPSLYEGFGLPALEAMAAGIPTLVAAGTAADEVTAPGAWALDPHDASAWRAALAQLVADPALAADWGARGRRVAEQYRWADTVRATWAVYRRAAGQGGGGWRGA